MALTVIKPSGIETSGNYTVTGMNVSANATVANLSVTTSLTLLTNSANLGPVGNVIITGGTNGYVLQTDGAGNLSWVAQSGGGSISNISNGNSNVNIPTANGNVNITAVGNTTMVITGTGVNVAGTLNVTGNTTVGNLVTSGSGGTLSNINVVSANTFTASGNITAGNASLGNSVVANYFTGNFYGTANLATYATTANSVAGANVSGQVANALVSGTVYTNAQPNITSVGTLTDLSVSGNGVFGGNLTVNGTLTYINSTTLAISDPIINLQTGPNGAAPVANTGKDVGTALNYYDTSAKIAWMGWDVSNAEIAFGSNVGISSEVVTFTSLANIRSGNAQLGNNVSANFFTGNGSFLTGITTASISNGNSNVNIPAANGNVNISAVGNANIVVITGTGANITGTLNVTGNATVGNIVTSGSGGNVSNVNVISANTFIASGNLTAGNINTTGSGGNIGNANVISANTFTASGNITSGNANLGNAVIANFFIGSGNNLSNIQAANVSGQIANALISGTVYTNAQPNITSIGTLTGLTSTGTVNLTGASNVALGPVANVHITGGTNGQYLQTDGSGTLTWSTVSSGASSNISNGNSNVNIPAANGNINLTSVGNTIMVITGTGVNVAGTLNVTGNATVGNIVTSGSGGNVSNVNVISANTFIASGNLTAGNINTTGSGGNIANANVISANTFTASGNITSGNANLGNAVTSNYFIGNLYGTANLATYATTANAVAGANVSGQVANALITGTVYTNAQPNITSTGSLTGLTVSNATGVVNFTTTANVTLGAVGNLHISGGTNAYVLSTDGAGTLSWVAQSGGGSISNISNGNSNVNIPSANGNVNISAVGNANVVVITGTGINVAGTLNATGNASLGNLVTSGSGGNIANANVISANTFTASGNITANNINTTGSGGNIGNANVISANTFTASGNITSGNANLGNVVTANFFIGSGNNLSNISGANVSGQVANALITGTVYTNAQPNITSVGTLTGLTSTGTVNLTGASNVSLGPVANVKITGGSTGQYLQTDGTGTLTWATVSSGSTSNISNGNSNVNIPSANGNINLTAVGNTIMVITGTGVNIAGTLNATGNASLGNLVTSGSGGNIANANVISANTFTASGNITAGNANLGNLVTANFFTGNGSLLTGITVSAGNSIVNGNSNVVVASNANVTISSAGNANVVIVTGTGANINGYANITGNLVAGNITAGAGSGGNITGGNVISTNTFIALTSANFVAASNVNLGAVGNVKITGGTSSYVLSTDGTGNLSWIAGSSGSNISNGNSNVNIPSANGNINFSAVGNANVVVITGTGANISGTANVTGNLVAGNITAGAGSGGSITGGNLVSANYFTGTLTTAAQPNITSVGSLTGLTVSNATGVVNLTTTANVTLGAVANLHISGGTSGQYLQTDGSGTLTWATVSSGSTSNISNGNSNVNIPSANGNVNISAVGNANVVVITGTGVNVAGYTTITGNLTAGNINAGSGTGGNITGANLVSANYLTGTLTTAAQPNITSVGSLTGLTVSNATGVVNLTTTANVTLGAVANLHISGGTTGQYLSTDGSGTLSWSTVTSGSTSNISNGNSNVNIPSANGNVNISAVGNANVVVVTGTGVNVAGYTTITGNLTAGNINAGSGTGGNITGANLVSANYLTGTLTTAAQPNITSVGTLTGLTSNGVVNFANTSNATLGAVGNVHISGGTNGQYLQTDGSGTLSWSTVISGSSSNISNGNSNVNIPSANGNINLTAVGNTTMVVTGTGVNVAGYTTITGNLTAGNINAGSGTGGNITGANLVSANYLTGTLTTAAQPNITSVGTLTSLTVTGNITSGNANLGNSVTANYFTGNFYGTANSATTAGTVTTAAQPNITSVGSLTGLTVSNATGVVNFTTSANVTLGAVANLHIAGGSNGQYLQTDGSGTLTWSTVSSGSSSNISNGNSNVNIPAANGNVNISAVGNANVLVITGTGINVAGTLNATGNASLGNLVTSGSGGNIANANVISANTFTASGNITGANANLGNAVTANYFTGNFYGTANLATYATTANAVAGGNVSGQVGNSLIAGTVYTNAQPNITSVGSLTGLTVSNATGVVDFTTTANVTLGAVGNLHISGGTNGYVLSTDGSGTLSWVAQSGGGGGASISNGNSNVNIPAANGNINFSAVGNANVVVITGTGANINGTLNVTGQSNLGAVGNVIITGGTANYVLSTDGAGNLSWAAQTGGNAANVTVDNFTGNGVQTIFTLSTTPIGINQTSVNYNGATVLRTDYTLANANITFSSAPANGSLIEVTTINLTTSGGGGGASSAAAVGYSLIFGG